jgi:hypothetical protein
MHVCESLVPLTRAQSSLLSDTPRPFETKWTAVSPLTLNLFLHNVVARFNFHIFHSLINFILLLFNSVAIDLHLLLLLIGCMVSRLSYLILLGDFGRAHNIVLGSTVHRLKSVAHPEQ